MDSEQVVRKMVKIAVCGHMPMLTNILRQDAENLPLMRPERRFGESAQESTAETICQGEEM